MTHARPMFPPRADRKTPSDREAVSRTVKTSDSSLRGAAAALRVASGGADTERPESAVPTEHTSLTASQDGPLPLYVRTDMSPADLFKALGDARSEAAAAIEQLIAILDLIDGNCDLEPDGDELDDDDDSEIGADSEPSLAALENHPVPPVPTFRRKGFLRHSDQSGDQTGWGDQGNADDREGDAGYDDREGDELTHSGESEREDDELSGDEHEPSLGSFDRLTNQDHGWRQTAGNSRTWAMHRNEDFEADAST